MKRLNVAAALVSCVALVACGGHGNRDNSANEKAPDVRPATVTETGCLTARGDQFVLTDLERGAGATATETFQLVGKEDELRQHVGKQIRITGEAEAPKVAVVRESTPPTTPAKPEAAPTTGRAEPKVSSETETRVDVRKLTVTSVEPTGGSCAAETRPGGGA